MKERLFSYEKWIVEVLMTSGFIESITQVTLL